MKKSLFRLFYDGNRNIDMEGSFHQALYHLWFKADAGNKIKLLKGFPDFFTKEDYEYFCGPMHTEIEEATIIQLP